MFLNISNVLSYCEIYYNLNEKFEYILKCNFLW